MKLTVLCLLILMFSSSAHAQSQDEKSVAAATEQLRKALLDADKIALDRLTSDSLSYGHSSGRVETKKQFIENLVSGKSDFVTIDITEQTISISHDNAIVRHVLTATTNDSGVPGNTKLRVLLVWQKEKGKWKLLARQSVKYS
jgi:ketosteroid isomerase-like protein